MDNIITLKHGTKIELSNIGLIPWIHNHKYKTLTLCYDSNNRFYLNMKGYWLIEESFVNHLDELNRAMEECKEANSLILKETKK